MQIALLESTVLSISVKKRGLMAFAVKKVLGIPALYGAGGGAPVWYVYSDPSIGWRGDVRRLIAVIENIGDFPDTGPPAGFPDVGERKAIGPSKAPFHAAHNAVKGWAEGRLPAMPPNDGGLSVEELQAWFERPWLRFSTEGMVPVDEDGNIIDLTVL